MQRSDLEQRITDFVVRALVMVRSLPSERCANVIANQVVRSATSIGANYRETARASSKRHFVTTLEIAQREASETEYWLELVERLELVPVAKLHNLRQENAEITRILTASARTAKGRKPDSKSEMRDEQ